MTETNKTETKKLNPAAKLLLKIIGEESKDGICKLKDSELTVLMDCNGIYIDKLLKVLRDSGDIKTKKIGRTEREIKIIKSGTKDKS